MEKSKFPAYYVLFSTLILLSTEVLSAFHLLTPNAVRIFWLLVFSLCIFTIRKKQMHFSFPRFSQKSLAVMFIPFLTFIQGFLSAPNTTDAMVYHLPRVMYWMQERSVWQSSVFTAHDYMPPLSGFFLAQLYLFFGNDRFLFLSQWIAGITCLFTVFLLSQKLGAKKEDSYWLTLFAGTLPILAFQMSSTQVDLTTTAFVLCAYWFGIAYSQKSSIATASLLSLSAGLSLMTKPSAVFWLIPLALFVLQSVWKKRNFASFIQLMAAGLLALGLQVRWLSQNYFLFGSLLGRHVGSSGVELIFSNERVSFGIFIANIVRNVSLQLPIPFFGSNLQGWIESMLGVLGTSLQDPHSTWYGSSFTFQRMLFPQEDIIASPVHMLLILSSTVVLFKKNKWQVGDILLALNWVGFLFFSLVLKWQPYNSRLLIPFLMLGTVFSLTHKKIGIWMKRVIILHVLVTMLLVAANVSHPFFSYMPIASAIRPLMPASARVPTSVFTTPRNEQYFHARPYWFGPYESMSELLEGNQVVDPDLVDGYLYPLMKLSKDHDESIRFVNAVGMNVWSGESSSTPSGGRCFTADHHSLCHFSTSQPGTMRE